mmetsp:Transcript_50281/g.60477  ORF Transcript_50281/g.60477 Transcript_50281/m.60477 type:complete len:146 (+) Transcript_50281:563-1000(+)
MLNKSITLCDMNHHLDGVLIITPFQIAHCVIKVCVCGSSDSRSFVEAFDYYSLQDIDSSAKKSIKIPSNQTEKVIHSSSCHEEFNRYVDAHRMSTPNGAAKLMDDATCYDKFESDVRYDVPIMYVFDNYSIITVYVSRYEFIILP